MTHVIVDLMTEEETVNFLQAAMEMSKKLGPNEATTMQLLIMMVLK